MVLKCVLQGDEMNAKMSSLIKKAETVFSVCLAAVRVAAIAAVLCIVYDAFKDTRFVEAICLMLFLQLLLQLLNEIGRFLRV
jgi:hypothetical protein